MEEADLVIVGAGWFGLATARTYLQINPSAKVLILDEGQSIGGVWAKERVYPSLRSNNLLGCYEFWDYPMDPKLFDVKPGKAIPGHVIHEYFASYAEHFNLTGLIRYHAHVESAERQDPEGWLLAVSSTAENGHQVRILAKTLVVATGLTSDPFLPHFDGQDEFDMPIIHSKYFKANASTLTSSKDVVIFGGTKSAWDAAYAYASSGADVHWVIRESGHGPTWLTPPFVTPLKKQTEKLLMTRLIAWLSPCIWGDADGYSFIRQFLHGTWLGRIIVTAFFAILGNDVMTLNKYDEHPDTKKLKPWNSPFWIGTSLSILTYDSNIFELVRSGKIKVHVADIDHLSESTVHLKSGVELPADVLFCATGWQHKPPIKFLPEGIDADIGLPISEAPSPSQARLIERADVEVLTKFPMLKHQPHFSKAYQPLSTSKNASSQGYRLYRSLVPSDPTLLQRRDLAFAGSLLTIGTVITAQIQALWITAFFTDHLPPLSPSKMQDSAFASKVACEATLWARFNALRHPPAGNGFGTRFPDLAFEGLPYIDVLLQDLGLNRWRKKGRVWNEWLSPYGKEDYRGLVEEWMEREGRKLDT